MAETVQLLGAGGASAAAEEKLGWNRGTIRKGQYELETQPREDNFSGRGRNKSEDLFPHLLDDIKKIAESECQMDPSFNSCRLYTRLTAEEVRKRLLETGYYDEKHYRAQEKSRSGNTVPVRFRPETP